MLLLTLLSVTLMGAPEPSARLLPEASAKRISEIDLELRKLRATPSAGEVFTRTADRWLPAWALSALPIALGSLLIGPGQSVSSQQTDVVGRTMMVAAIGAGISTAVYLSVCFFAVVEHWIDEATEKPLREAKAAALEQERLQLQDAGP